MKVVIMAGGMGSRISEESHLRPKPMIEIGEKPILWHIMKIYSAHGYNDFVICCGYKGYHIKEYFADYFLHNSDVTFDYRNGNAVEVHTKAAEPWRVTLIDTGLSTMTGGRLKRVAPYLDGETFMLTYGDGVADIDLAALLRFHKEHEGAATITSVPIAQRFGVIDVDEMGTVTQFREKAEADCGLINGGFMVLEPKVLEYIDGDTSVLEQEVMENLSADGLVRAYQHNGFWQCMDTQRDREKLEALWSEGSPPWRVW